MGITVSYWNILKFVIEGKNVLGTILIVDDEATQLRIMESVLTRMGFGVRTASDGKKAMHILESSSGSEITLMILDLSMPVMSGIDVLKAIRPSKPDLPIIVLTAHSSLSNVVEAMQAGANDFISKPASAERIRIAITSAIEQDQLVGEIEPISSSLPANFGFDNLVGSSKKFQNTVRLAKKAAQTKIPVLIEGESGVGKELFARAIQMASDRRNKPFITVNCGAIPENLVESILFGHEKGAFTGAQATHIGKFEEANGGTLFLDEVGELPQDIQVKLLRALQEGEIDPVGASSPKKIDIRIISASNRNLLNQISKGNFREDLYYRLNVFPLHIPSLRERRSDISVLCDHFIKIIHESEDIKEKKMSKEVKELLEDYHWPGNIRQLQNAIFRAVVMCEGDTLTLDEFEQISTARESHSSFSSLKRLAKKQEPIEGHISLVDIDENVRNFQELEKEIIKYALEHYNWRMSQVSRRLNIGRSTLYRKVEEYGLSKK